MQRDLHLQHLEIYRYKKKYKREGGHKPKPSRIKENKKRKKKTNKAKQINQPGASGATLNHNASEGNGWKPQP